MYLHEIGTSAGIIWSLLAEHDGMMTMKEITDLADFKEGIFPMAIGWLARENKIHFVEKNRAVYIQLDNCVSEMYF